jgi:hypothetical protein
MSQSFNRTTVLRQLVSSNTVHPQREPVKTRCIRAAGIGTLELGNPKLGKKC